MTLAKTLRHSAIVFALGMVAAGASLSVCAATSEENRTVKITDLDLNSVAGAETLYVRLREAASSVCGLANGSDPITRPAWLSCRAATLAAAVRKVHSPMLTKVYETHNASEERSDELLSSNTPRRHCVTRCVAPLFRPVSVPLGATPDRLGDGRPHPVEEG